MNGFWQSSTGNSLTGKAEDAFASQFKIIPDGTQASACIKSVEFVPATNYGSEQMQIKWKLVTGDYKGFEVRQKINIFDLKPEKADRAKNMLVLICKLLNFELDFTKDPHDINFGLLNGKILGLKIQEFCVPKEDGGFFEGNWVSEVHPASELEVLTGTKMQTPIHTSSASPLESALNRNATAGVTTDDIPF
ncbi:MAG: hypothetical protein V4506_12525 [Bacteroidota bacterium]